MKSVVAVACVGLAALALGGCRISTKERITRAEGDVEVTAGSDLVAGEKISVASEGVTASGVLISANGGYKVQRAGGDRVSIKARIIGYAFPEDEDDARAAMQQVVASVKLEKVNGVWQASCSKAAVGEASAGCEYIEISVPAGTVARPIDITLASPNGGIEADLRGDVVSGFAATTNGLGSIKAGLVPAQGSVIRLNSTDGEAALFVPEDTSADVLTVTGGAGTGSEFDQTTGTLGTAGEGAAEISVRAEEAAKLFRGFGKWGQGASSNSGTTNGETGAE